MSERYVTGIKYGNSIGRQDEGGMPDARCPKPDVENF